MIQKLRLLVLVAGMCSWWLPKLQAQNAYLDSLKSELKRKDLADSARMDILITLGKNLGFSNEGQAIRYLNTAYSFARSKNNKYVMGLAMSGLGDAQYYAGNYDSAMYYYLQADGWFKQDPSAESQESVATNSASMANVELARNNYETAINYFLHAIDVMEKSKAGNKYKALGNLYGSVGNVYHDMDQYEKALAYDLKGLAAHQKEKDNRLLTAYMELYVAGDYVDLKQMDAAAFHLSHADQLAKQLNAADLFNQVYSNWGSYYRKSGKPDRAIASYKTALAYALKAGHKFGQMNDLRMLGMAYRDKKLYRQSAASFSRALQLIRELDNKRLEAETVKNLADVYAAQHLSDKAAAYYRQYIQLTDSLNTSQTQKKINEIENKYQAEKKQAQINVLQKNSQLQQLQIRQKNIWAISLTAGLVLLLLTGVLLYKNFKTKNRLLLQNQELHRQRINELEKERQLIAMQSVMKGQEEERSRLARDLHDGLGGLLSGVKLSLSTMKGNVFLSEENAQAFNSVIGQLNHSIAELRRISHNMMPEALIKYGLKEALENYCENLNLSEKIKIRLQAYGMEQRMELGTEIILYRIVQELLSNSIKHADAKNVLIQIIREGNRFNLTVEDDGKGFDVNDAKEKGGAGLANIMARAEYLGGTADINSKKGEGTSVLIEGNCA